MDHHWRKIHETAAIAAVSVIRLRLDAGGVEVVVVDLVVVIGLVSSPAHPPCCSLMAIVVLAKLVVQHFCYCSVRDFGWAFVVDLLSSICPVTVPAFLLPVMPSAPRVLSPSFGHPPLPQTRRMTGRPVEDRNSSMVRQNDGDGSCL